MHMILKGVIAFFWLSAIVLVVSMVWAGFAISEHNDQCQQKGGVLVKTGVDGYICIDRNVVK